MGDTKKVKHAGRFGSRYGKGIRDRIVGIETKQRTLHVCPGCGFKRVKRITTGLFKCKKCGYKFSGGSYTPNTMSGRVVKKMVDQKKFLPLAKNLLEIQEEREKGLNEKKQEAKEALEETVKKKPAKKKKEKKAIEKSAEQTVETETEEDVSKQIDETEPEEEAAEQTEEKE